MTWRVWRGPTCLSLALPLARVARASNADRAIPILRTTVPILLRGAARHTVVIARWPSARSSCALGLAAAACAAAPRRRRARASQRCGWRRRVRALCASRRRRRYVACRRRHVQRVRRTVASSTKAPQQRQRGVAHQRGCDDAVAQRRCAQRLAPRLRAASLRRSLRRTSPPLPPLLTTALTTALMTTQLPLSRWSRRPRLTRCWARCRRCVRARGVACGACNARCARSVPRGSRRRRALLCFARVCVTARAAAADAAPLLHHGRRGPAQRPDRRVLVCVPRARLHCGRMCCHAGGCRVCGHDADAPAPSCCAPCCAQRWCACGPRSRERGGTSCACRPVRCCVRFCDALTHAVSWCLLHTDTGTC
jgi:hypothetical protein